MLNKIPIALCIVLSAFFVYFPITDCDIFWHLAAGREMVAHRHFLYADPFSFTLASPRWVDLHWLFQLLAYGLYSLAGFKALIGVKLLLVAGTAALICLTHRSPRYRVVAAFLTPLLFYATRYLIDVRPVIITLLFTAAYVFLFERSRASGRKKLLWWCIPLQILWTNSQGLYMVGLFIIGAYWAESVWDFFRHNGRKPVMETVFLICATASCLINPYGMSGLLLPFELLSRINPAVKNIYSMNISENVPLLSLSGFESIYRSAVITTAAIAVALFILNRKRIRPAHIVLFAGFCYLAFSAVRNVPLYAVIVVPLIGYYAADSAFWKWCASLPSGYRRGISLTASTLVLCMFIVPIIRHAAIVSIYPPHRALAPFRFPEKCVSYLKSNPVPGAMFNDIRYGGYLIWRLYPKEKVFIDTRLIIRTPEFFAEYLAISDHPGLFAQVAEKFNVTHVVLPSAFFSRHQKLVRRLYESDRWRLECTDGESLLFVRSDVAAGPGIDLAKAPAVQQIADSLQVQWNNAPHVCREALQHFSDLLKGLGLDDAAGMVARRIESGLVHETRNKLYFDDPK
jgi:hypothetical protein